MFDLVRNNKRIVQVFLLLITIPFALWGVDAYLGEGGGGVSVASVGGEKISQAEFMEELRKQQERLRAQFGPAFDAKMLDTPEARTAVVDGLINARLINQAAAKAGLAVSDEQLRQVIASAPALQDNGKFSPERYQAFVRSQNLSEAAFESRLRQDLTQQQLLGAVGQSGFVAGESGKRWASAMLEEREVSVHEIKPDAYLARASVTPEAVKKFYDEHPKHFETPERLRAEFVVLSQDALAKDIKVGEDEIKKRYEAQSDRYKEPEQRRASHILIAVDAKAPEAQQKAAQAKAEDLLKQVRANPASFAKLAAENSDDPGSKKQGGDLDFFSRGAMVKPFEDAVFSLKENEISGLVRSDFGFHIIKLTAVKAARSRSLADVGKEISAELAREAAAKRFSEAAESFSNMVFEQSDSLKPAAEKYKLTIQQSDWVNRGARANWPLTSEKLLTALFSDDAIKHKRNTEVVDVGDNTLVGARVLEHKPAAKRAFEEVRAEILEKLQRDEAVRLAVQAGTAAVVDLQKGGKGGEVDPKWGEPQRLSRLSSQRMPPELAKTIFAMPADKLPRYAGMPTSSGPYLLFRLSSVRQPESLPAERADELARRLERLMADEDVVAFLKALRANTKVTVNQAAMETRER